MKIAVAGKGGTGKTTAVTLLATYLAKESKVLAFDVDTNENLAYSLGFSEEKIKKMDKIRNHLDEIFEYTKTEKDWTKRKYAPNKNANYYEFGDKKINKFIKQITLSKENLFVGHLGNVEEENRGIENMCDSFTLMRIFLNHLKIEKDSYLLVDLAAGNDLITRSTIINMDEVLLTVEPTSKNLSVAKDILISLKALQFENVFILINKSFRENDIELVSKELKIDVKNIRRIPFSQELLELDNENELTFDKVSDEVKKSIREVLELLKKNKKRNTLGERARNLDSRFSQINI